VRRVVVECAFCGIPVTFTTQTIDVTGLKEEEVDPAGNLAPGVPLREGRLADHGDEAAHVKLPDPPVDPPPANE
jgi:hypothetical protein